MRYLEHILTQTRRGGGGGKGEEKRGGRGEGEEKRGGGGGGGGGWRRREGEEDENRVGHTDTMYIELITREYTDRLYSTHQLYACSVHM